MNSMTLADTMYGKLAAAFDATQIEIVNESHLHAGHAGSPGTGESHFRIRMIAGDFTGKSRLERQRAVYHVLADELAGPVHALSLTLHDPGEAQQAPLKTGG